MRRARCKKKSFRRALRRAIRESYSPFVLLLSVERTARRATGLDLMEPSTNGLPKTSYVLHPLAAAHWQVKGFPAPPMTTEFWRVRYGCLRDLRRVKDAAPYDVLSVMPWGGTTSARLPSHLHALSSTAPVGADVPIRPSLTHPPAVYAVTYGARTPCHSAKRGPLQNNES